MNGLPFYAGAEPEAGYRGFNLPSSINSATDELCHFDGTLQSTQGSRPNAGHDAEILERMGAFGGAVEVASSLAYSLTQPTDFTIVVWRDSKIWSEYEGLTWTDLEEM